MTDARVSVRLLLTVAAATVVISLRPANSFLRRILFMQTGKLYAAV